MTQARTRITYAEVRPGMTVTTYSGQPIQVTEVRHLVRLLGEGRGWTRTVELTGWLERARAPFDYVEHCYQLPERRTELIDDDAEAKKRRFWASVDDDAAIMRTTHDYSRRLVELDLNIRIELFDMQSHVG